MKGFEIAQCITEAKQEIEKKYNDGELTKEERDFQLTHILGW